MSRRFTQTNADKESNSEFRLCLSACIGG